jgi:hypothetical protein
VNTLTLGTRPLTRIAFLFVFVALLGMSSLRIAHAADQGAERAHDNSITQIQVCEAMGGEAEVTTHMTGAGDYQVYVECHGGYMDGFDCINDTVETKCEFSRFQVTDDRVVIEPVSGLKPLDEPVETPPIIDTGAVTEHIEPVVVDQPESAEESATPTPDSGTGGEDNGNDGDGDTGGGVIVDDSVLVDPVVSDGGSDAAPEPTAEPTKGEVIIDRDPLIKDPSILEPIILDDPLAPPVEKVQDVEIK